MNSERLVDQLRVSAEIMDAANGNPVVVKLQRQAADQIEGLEAALVIARKQRDQP